MKIGTPELKTKPMTKNFDHGYISFKTISKELFFRVTLFDEKKDFFLLTNEWHDVENEDHLELLLSVKTREDILTITKEEVQA